MEFIRNTHFDFLGKKKFSFVISSVLVILGIIEVITMLLGTANIGIDFTGGLTMQLLFKHKLNVPLVRKSLTSGGFKDIKIIKFKGKNECIIKTKLIGNNITKYADKLKSVVKKSSPGNPFKVISNEMVGPSVGSSMTKDAIIAIIIAIVSIVIYITWRFEFRFGAAAAIGLAHDILALLGVIFIFDKEITLLVITAILTVAGYSLTDKVVVFDRIRENLKLESEQKQPINLTNLVNKSINEVLTRTVVTSLTVILVVLSLFFLGGSVLHDFAFTLLFGVIIGTYSSIFIASPIMVIFNEKYYK
ncbi:MAG: protein translocase subunit SecF [Candidatus Acididesulfobacter guangdongensis]|uniref:Protein-export membrane protein SecF n=1 Tax=Acididesulfobacter guangdongensis TaxID=2597225 RepID=A0A519BHK8_ACIG2|nr:MAG: protein translocase subunit SecF [Candidatus Acididesulfobacter guangdongensis]